MSIVSERIAAAIEGFAEPLLADMGLELVEVQYRQEGHGWVLRLFIDREEQGVTLDDCATVSREISAYLEVEEIIEHAYNLEVSSPGLERPLKRKEDFVRFVGRKARVKLRQALDGQRVFVGILRDMEDQSVVLEVEGEQMLFEMETISKARLSL